jgi:hypothetical protein
MSPSEASSALAASDKAWLGSGFTRYRLRVRVHGSCVVVDPQQGDVTASDASERLFGGGLHAGADGEGSVLDGGFYLHWLARFIFFPVPLLAGLGVSVVAMVHPSNWPVGLLAVPFLFFAGGYVIPRLRVVDARRGEAMLREWLTTLLASD